ncbi:MAG: type II toxin-antitoxin system HicA family toxin [Bacteroidia bacterium]|nr:type II toxin-antitoxin system HicA family toxin [Bacteroidia bacterium]
MKRLHFERHLKANGCILLRQGSNHSIWENPTNDNLSAVPRHKELDNRLCKNICKQLGIQAP